VNFIVFTCLTIAYSFKFFLLFLAGSVLYFGWMLLFLPARKRIDSRRFQISSAGQNNTMELVHGMQEIKLNVCEKQKRWKWELLQAKIFRINISSLYINQLQSSGAALINQGKNLVITYLASTEVVAGNLTLGEMMALQYIIGQLNSPVQQLIQFVQGSQDAKISLDRINEVQGFRDENPVDRELHTVLPVFGDIEFRNLSFSYPSADSRAVLRNVNFTIPRGKVTAIVGMSGSGKSTLLKLLLRFYDVEEGEIRLGGLRFTDIHTSAWRERCGVVLQDGYIFSDTIAANIAVSDDVPDMERLRNAARMANILEFVESLPLHFYTKIGASGHGLSQGQKQRMLIARAVYKDPDYIFFDEATNALDSKNESAIMENMDSFLKGKTAVVVAHRMSTIFNADQIVVIQDGEIKEIGKHEELLCNRGVYYELVKKQLHNHVEYV
jgi:ATP-binding cassette subfamily B protein